MTINPGIRLRIRLLKQTEKVSYFCNTEKKTTNTSVHQIRRTLKGIRSLLHFLYQSDQSGYFKNEAQKIHDLAKQLAPIRESYVNLFTFEKIIYKDQVLKEITIRKIGSKILNENKYYIENFLKTRENPDSIKNEIKDFEDKIKSFDYSNLTLFNYIENIISLYAIVFEMMNQVNKKSPSEDWHKLRKKSKTLWYQLKFLKFACARFIGKKIKQIEKITEKLGKHHDLEVMFIYIKNNYINIIGKQDNISFEKCVRTRQNNLVEKLLPEIKNFTLDSPEKFQGMLKKED